MTRGRSRRRPGRMTRGRGIELKIELTQGSSRLVFGRTARIRGGMWGGIRGGMWGSIRGSSWGSLQGSLRGSLRAQC